MKPLLLTNEYPPHIYGGAGVHVEYLARELSRLMPVEVRCFGDQLTPPGANPSVLGVPLDKTRFHCPQPLESVFGAARRCVDFAAAGCDATVVHCHTWYAALAGIFIKLNYGIPLVVTVHSLEPLRPWKREQLAGGYDYTLWVEKTALEMADAIVAVSRDTREDILRHFPVHPDRIFDIYNGIDPDEYRPTPDPAVLVRHGINPDQPYLLFVGRITRQKGIIHLVNAIRHLDPGFQVVLCAGAPDTPEIAAEMRHAVTQAQALRPGVVWIPDMIDNPSKITLYTHASVFCCPSIYEPFGIINLEAMACETPVVASAVGGIKEVVRHEETGLLIPFTPEGGGSYEPLEPESYALDLAHAINRLMADPALRDKMAHAGRQRALDHFSWSAIARHTQAMYQRITKTKVEL